MDSPETVLDPVFWVDGTKRGLPWILHALEDGRNVHFDHLRPYQQHLWHLFLVRVAAMLGPTRDWEETLCKQGDIWDIEPADGEVGFFQPAGDFEDYKPCNYLEQEDIIKVNGSNHKYKLHAFKNVNIDYVLYSLVCAQTGSRHEAWHRQSIRTSSGYGDRPYISKVPELEWSDRFHSDVELAQSLHGEKEGIQFLWTQVFQRDLSWSECHPLMVDSSRRYRIRNGFLHINASWDWPLVEESTDLHLELEDPWLPIDVKDETAKGTPEFSYKRVRAYLAQEKYHIPSLQQRSDESTYFIGQTVAGKKGGSEGYQERVVRLPAEYQDALFPEGDDFDRRSKQYVDVASKGRTVLWKGVSNLDIDASAYARQFESRIDQIFFMHLFEHATATDGLDLWRGEVTRIAKELFEQALQEVSDWAVKAKAENIFLGSLDEKNAIDA